MEKLYRSINISDNFIPQGICNYDDHIIISFYDGKKIENSILRVYDKELNLVNTFSLGNKTHAGGLCLDKRNNLIWVTDEKGCIKSYNIGDVITKNDASLVNKYDIGDKLISVFGFNSVAFINIYRDKLYAGNYSKENESIIKVYDINGGNIDKDKYSIINSVKYGQGICLFNYKDNEYLAISSSHSIEFSKLRIYEYHENIDLRKDEHITYRLPRMLEGINFKDNKLYLLFEKNAKKYRLFNNQKDVEIINIEDIIKLS